MRFTVIGSNSSGNAYLLESSTDTLLIECGVRFAAIKRALNFKISNVSAIVSHAHGDHSKSIAETLKAGISVYSGIETLKAKGVEGHHRAHVIEANKTYSIGSFRVKPLPVNHDVPCFCFLIQHTEMGLCVFLTDTVYSDYVFPGANHFLIECNHAVDILESGNSKQFLRDRIVQSHMNLDTCKDLLLANDLTSVNNIVLIHLSDTNSHARRFKKEIEGITGKQVSIAEPGLVIESFNKTPF